MKIPYFPGCSLKTYAAEFENSALDCGKELGIELVELPRWNCCGVVSSLTSDDLMHHLAPVRNMLRLSSMKREGLVDDANRLLILCSMCMNTFKRTNLRMKEKPDDLQTLNDFMYMEEDKYQADVEIVHLLELLKEKGFDWLEKQVKLPLKNLKVAPYYGCMLIRPKEVGIDDAEEPRIFEDFVKALQAEPVSWHARKTCCGSYLTVNNKDTVVKLAKKIIDNAREKGADLIITSCPLCAFNLDNRQKAISEKFPGFQTLPVIYFTQLLSLALGLPLKEDSFARNWVDPLPLLKQKVLNKKDS